MKRPTLEDGQEGLPFPQLVDAETQRRFDASDRVCREHVAAGHWNRLAFTRSEWKMAGRDPSQWQDADFIEFAPVNGRPPLRCDAFIVDSASRKA